MKRKSIVVTFQSPEELDLHSRLQQLIIRRSGTIKATSHVMREILQKVVDEDEAGGR